MIENLTVKNIALIEDVSINFEPGLNILTGETGAGKSILVGSLGLLLGNKADSDLIRRGKEEGVVSAVFQLGEHLEGRRWLDSRGIELEDNSLLLRRTLRRQGRGTIFIQSTPVTQQELSDFTDLLVDMHSQHAHQSLLRADNHRKLLDHFAQLDGKVLILSEKFYRLSDLKKEEESLLKSEAEREREIDYLEFALKEIGESNLKEGEDISLETEFKVASQAEKLFSFVNKFNESVTDSHGGALSTLREGVQALGHIAQIDESQATNFDRFQSAFYEIEDIAGGLSHLREQMDFSPETLDRLQSRLQIIRRIYKKYGGSIEAVLEYQENSFSRIAVLKDSVLSLEKLNKQMLQLEAEIRQEALDISTIRKTMAKELEEKVTQHLVDLGMLNAQFAISIMARLREDGKPGCSSTGIDVIRFLFSANLGEPLKELRSIASGGELSRVMLAIKSVFADKDPIQTLVFDEIDTGIGGAVARSIAKYIAALGNFKQILCITHLATIAAKATTHYQIVKETLNGETSTKIIKLEGEQRIREIGRMLSGDSNTSVSLDHARQLISENF